MFRKYTLLLVLACVSTSLGAADCAKCDCAHWPWKDACNGCCSLKVLNNSSPKELHRFLSLDDPLTKQVSGLKAKGPISSVDDLEKKLTPEQMDQIRERIKELPPLERQYLLASPDEKTAIQNDIRESHKSAVQKGAPPS